MEMITKIGRTIRNNRRKFRSQTSDNMDRWKAEQGRGREKRKIRRKKSRRERVRRKKMQMREKVGKSRNTVFFQWFGAPEGWKVGSLKRRVRSQLARWEMKNCTPLWREAHLQVKMHKTPGSRTTFGSCDVEKAHCTPLWHEAHFEVKMYKTPQCRTAFGSWDVEEVHAVVARSTFPSQNVQSSTFGPLLEVEMSKKCTPLRREAHFQVKMHKALGVRTTFGGSDVVSRGRRKGLCTSSKVSKTWGFCSISKDDGRHGTFEEDLQRCIFRGRRSTKDMFMRDVRYVRRSGRWFSERGCILEHQMCRLAKMILRDGCSTSFDLASIFRGRGNTLDRWVEKSQNALVRRCQLCTQLSIFEGSLAEFFRFWCLELRKMRKSRRIASFRMLSSSKNEDVSQTCFVLVVMFKH